MQQRRLTFVHGFMGHPTDWDEVRESIAQSPVRAESHAIEIQPAADWKSSLTQMAASIPESSLVIGYSMGARLSLGIALAFAEKVRGLMLVSGNPGLETDDARRQRLTADLELADRIAKWRDNREKLAFLKSWYQQPVFAGLPDEVRQSEIRRKLESDSQHWPAILKSHSVAQQPNYWPRLQQLSMPVWVIAGNDDKKYHEIAVRFHETCRSPNVACKIIPNCGHIVHREQPDTMLQMIQDFVGALDSSQA